MGGVESIAIHYRFFLVFQSQTRSQLAPKFLQNDAHIHRWCRKSESITVSVVDRGIEKLPKITSMGCTMTPHTPCMHQEICKALGSQ